MGHLEEVLSVEDEEEVEVGAEGLLEVEEALGGIGEVREVREGEEEVLLVLAEGLVEAAIRISQDLEGAFEDVAHRDYVGVRGDGS